MTGVDCKSVWKSADTAHKASLPVVFVASQAEIENGAQH